MDTAFKPLPHKIITVTIDENGDQVFLKIDAADCFLECGETVTRRASHVEPMDPLQRLVFSLLRTLFADESAVAAWTRTWRCMWRINTKPVGGPVLTWGDLWTANGTFATLPWVKEMSQWGSIACFSRRQAAIDNEILFLNHFFAERKI